MLELELEKEKPSANSVNSKLNALTLTLQTAAEKSMPSIVFKLKSPTWKVSPIVKDVRSICKEK